MNGDTRPDVIVIMTDEERAAPPYETDELRQWRSGLSERLAEHVPQL